MAQSSISAVERLNERASQCEARLSAVADGRTVDPEQPQWKLPRGGTAPLSRQERDLVIRRMFLVGGATFIATLGSKLSAAANDALAQAYLRLDDEIGPVCIMFGAEKNDLIFGDGAAHVLTKQEQASLDRFYDAIDAFRAELGRQG